MSAAIAGVANGTSMGAALAGGPMGSVIGMLAASACGLDINNGSLKLSSADKEGVKETFIAGVRGYEIGSDLFGYLQRHTSSAVSAWAINTLADFVAKGGVSEGDTFDIPPEVTAAIQQWTVTNFDFSGGIVTYEDYLLYHEGNTFVMTDVDMAAYKPTASGSQWQRLPVYHVGSLVNYQKAGNWGSSWKHTFEVSDEISFTTEYTLTGEWSGSLYLKSINGFAIKYVTMSKYSDFEDYASKMDAAFADNTSFYALMYSPSLNKIWPGLYVVSSNELQIQNQYGIALGDDAVGSIAGSIGATDRLEEDIDEPVPVTVPKPVGTQEVDGMDVPIFDVLTPEAVTTTTGEATKPGEDAQPTAAPVPGITAGEITGAIVDALPVTGTIAGDAVMGEVAADPEGLGAVFISKFPFSIPWDVYKAIKLLAAPPVTPRWEMDFFGPFADVFGGFGGGSTAIVIDFSEVPLVGTVTRWFSTVLFVYALAAGTKRLIWTA